MACVLTVCAASSAIAAETLSARDLDAVSIEDLGKIDVTSVSKVDQPLSDAPAAIYVITHDDIIRSGATSLPDILRLAPNLQVAQITATSYAITARGFNGSAADKLLVLVDGRSVYTPFFSGVFWDVQAVPPEDIDRIEVISGPGATLWGANAVNGVINIITRKAAETQGALVSGSEGSLERGLSLQYGGRLGADIAYRVYGMAKEHDNDTTTAGVDARDGQRLQQAGFRVDWTPSRDLATLQGDLYNATDAEKITAAEANRGYNLLARWTHPMADGSTLQVQAYYDDLTRRIPAVASDSLHTYDLSAQHSFAWGTRQQFVWGGGFRLMQDRFVVTPGNISNPLTQFFNPEARTLTQSDLFGQDMLAITPALKLVLGLKIEKDPYVALAPLPSVRLSWKFTSSDLLWAAVSRAVRAPSRLDRDFFETSGSTLVLKGGDFQSEDLIAYEIGYRTQRSERLSFSVSAFYNVYQDLRTFDFAPGGGLPATIANRMEGETYGVEAWASYRMTDWWLLSGGANWLQENLRFKPGASHLGGIASAGDDPSYQVQLRSSMKLTPSLLLDLDLRSIGALPDPASPAYTELGGRLAWAATDRIELSVVGANLLHDHHLEFGSGGSSVQLGATGVEAERSVTVNARLKY